MFSARRKSKKTDPKLLMTFSEYNTFQGFYKITPADGSLDPERVFNLCILYVTGWLRERVERNKNFDKTEVQFLYDYPDMKDPSADGFDVFAKEEMFLKRAKNQFDISIFALKEFGEWTIRIREPNNQTETTHLDRLFTTDAALKLTDKYVYLAVRTKCKESHHHGKKAAAFRPAFLPGIFLENRFTVSEGSIASHDYPVNLKRISIERSGNRKKDDFEFIKIINDPGRQMPVIFCPAFDADLQKDKDTFRTDKLAQHMAGLAYVVTDEARNGYKDLIGERMSELLKKIILSPRDATTKIKTNYLCIMPLTDVGKKFEWFAIDPSIRSIEKPAQSENAIRKEIGRVEKTVTDRLLQMNGREGGPDIDHGDVLYYSDLWDAYISKTDSKVIEELNSKLEDAKGEIKRLIETQEENISEKLDEIIAEVKKKAEADFKKEKEADAERFKDQLKRKDRDIQEKQEALEKLEKEKRSLDEKLRKTYNFELENGKLKFIQSFLTKTYKGRALDTWVKDNMSKYIVFHKKGTDSYRVFNYPQEDILRNAFILLYANEMLFKGDMKEELYDKIKTDKMMSGFEIASSGKDAEKISVDGHDADWHVTYSEHNAGMFRIYYYRDEKTGMATVVSVTRHA